MNLIFYENRRVNIVRSGNYFVIFWVGDIATPYDAVYRCCCALDFEFNCFIYGDRGFSFWCLTESLMLRNRLLYNIASLTPKKIEKIPPLLFLRRFLQHVPPPYFQRTRRYGIHANVKSKQVKETIEKKLKRNGRTIRTVMEIISHLMHLKPFECSACESKNITITEVKPDKEWVYQWITLPRIRAPDNSSRIRPNTNPIQF